MAKKVLIFSLDYYPGEVGGAEVAIKEITDRISPEEIEFHLLTLHYDSNMQKEEQIGNVHVHRIGFGKPNPTIAERRQFPLHLNKHLFQFTAVFTAMRLHRRYRYDGIWAMMAHVCGVPAAFFSILYPDVKFLLTLQEGDPPEVIERKLRPVWPLFTRAFTRADIIQVISVALGEWATHRHFPGEPVRIPNGANIQHFGQTYTDAEIAAAQQELRKRDGEVFLVTTSRLVAKNGIDVVIRALAELPEHVRFVIFGNGPETQQLQRLAETCGVDNRVDWRGLIGHDEMPRYLKACDIFVRPSRSEGMGNSFIEAMAAELPVIATHVGGIVDFLFDAQLNPDKESTGWAVPVDDHVAIARAVEDIIANPVHTQATIARAKEMVTREYDWNIVAARMRSEVFAKLFDTTAS